MNIIDTLKTRVATSLFGGNTTPAQSSVLEQFLSLFVTQLANKDINLSGVNNTGNEILQRLFPDNSARQQMIDKLADQNQLNRSEAHSLVESAAPVAYNELNTMAAGQPIPQYLNQHIGGVLERVPAWAAGFLPAGLLAGFGAAARHLISDETYKVSDSAHAVQGTPVQTVKTTPVDTAKREPVKPAPVLTEVREDKPGLAKWLLPLIGLLILIPLLLWLMRSCSEKPQPVAEQPVAASAPASAEIAPVAAASTLVAPMMSVEVNDKGEISKCNAMVANDNLKTSIWNAIKAQFGDAANCDVTVDAKYDTNMPIADKLTDALTLIKGTPNARMDVNGNTVSVFANDQATADQLVGQLQTLMPAYQITGSTLPTAVAATTIPADQASVVWEDNKVKFYFATAKAEIGEGAVEKAKDILEQAKAGKNIGVSGYTDSTGDAKFNAELSKKRAMAVKQFLIDNGVPEAQIQLIKPEETTGAMGQNQEGRRVDAYIIQ